MPETACVIRQAGVRDREEVFSLVKDFSPGSIPDLLAFQTTFAALDKAAGSVLFVAENTTETVVGYILVSCRVSFLANAPVAWVEEVMVAKAWRRKQIGKALMGAAEGWAQQRGAAHITLASRQSGQFYLALGYENAATFFKKLLT